jgi:hypothetical protein
LIELGFVDISNEQFSSLLNFVKRRRKNEVAWPEFLQIMIRLQNDLDRMNTAKMSVNLDRQRKSNPYTVKQMFDLKN